jgi:hypothetical protein
VTDIIESVPKEINAQQLAARLVEQARAEGVDLVVWARKPGSSYAAWVYSLIRPLRIGRRWMFRAGRRGVGWAGLGGC